MEKPEYSELCYTEPRGYLHDFQFAPESRETLEAAIHHYNSAPWRGAAPETFVIEAVWLDARAPSGVVTIRHITPTVAFQALTPDGKVDSFNPYTPCDFNTLPIGQQLFPDVPEGEA